MKFLEVSIFSMLCMAAVVYGSQSRQELTFTNPIYPVDSPDPVVVRLGDSYYLLLSLDASRMTLFKNSIMTNFEGVESKVIMTPPEGYFNLWAPELHVVDGELYIYFCMDIGNGNGHRMFVIKADDPNEPMGTWSQPIRLIPDLERATIDGTLLQHGNGALYYMWADDGSLFLAPMINPTTVGGPRQLIRIPTSLWECTPSAGYCTNEGPYFIYNNNVSYLIFAAGSTWLPNYSLGMMSVHGSKDPMNPDNWVSWMGPVFWRNDEEDVYAPGHAAFTVSPDGTETWMAYHAAANTTHIGGFRTARLEKIEWNADGSPRFPRPHGYNSPQPVPSGQISH